VDPPSQPQDLDRLITDFTERVPEVALALVVSSDGVPVAASDPMQPDHLEKLSVITSGLIGLARGAAQVFDGDAFTQALVAMERGTLVIMAIDDGSSLAVLTTAAADLDQVAYEMTILVEQAGSIFTPPVRDPGSTAPQPPHPPASRASEADPHQAGGTPTTPPLRDSQTGPPLSPGLTRTGPALTLIWMRSLRTSPSS
jgi:predicted regulator of Ras-like GTPase activity (Roadblock/LC7/MglB family)